MKLLLLALAIAVPTLSFANSDCFLDGIAGDEKMEVASKALESADVLSQIAECRDEKEVISTLQKAAVNFDGALRAYVEAAGSCTGDSLNVVRVGGRDAKLGMDKVDGLLSSANQYFEANCR